MLSGKKHCVTTGTLIMTVNETRFLNLSSKQQWEKCNLTCAQKSVQMPRIILITLLTKYKLIIKKIFTLVKEVSTFSTAPVTCPSRWMTARKLRHKAYVRRQRSLKRERKHGVREPKVVWKIRKFEVRKINWQCSKHRHFSMRIFFFLSKKFLFYNK